MALTIYQKSVYLIILNATMILRSVGKSLKANESDKSVKDFKIKVFEKINKLTDLMDKRLLKENNILDSIKELSKEFPISFGQAQKPINVILKYHFYLTKNENAEVKKILYCPVDSIILRKFKKNKVFLTNIKEKEYLEIQREIEKVAPVRIKFDIKWDEQHLRDEGIL